MKNRLLLLLCAVFLVGGLVMLGCDKAEKPEAPSKKKAAADTPTAPDQPKAPAVPKVPEKADLPKVPEVPKVPEKADLPKVPEVPKEPAKPAAGAKQKTAWADAKVGDMVKYKMGKTTMTQKVVKVDAENIHLETLTEIPSMKMPAQTTKMPRFATPVKGEAPKAKDKPKDLGTKVIKVGGKSLTCKGSETKTVANGKTYTSRTWVSDQVPINGIVLSESDSSGKMVATMTLVEFKKGN